jgi:hypothetical protein
MPLVAWISEVAFRDDSEGAERREGSALGAIDLVHTVAVADQLASVPPWEVEVLREHVAGFIARVGRTATAVAASIDRIAPLSTVSCSRIVSVPHDQTGIAIGRAAGHMRDARSSQYASGAPAAQLMVRRNQAL